MKLVTFQVLEGVDKGRIFRDLSTPVTIGREEGNVLRLNDDRVSRFHAKVQTDNDDLILTDLESTNGTRVNGMIIQIRRLRFGDRINVGRSVLKFGSDEEIAARMASLEGRSISSAAELGLSAVEGQATVQAQTLEGPIEEVVDFDLNIKDQRITITPDALFIGNKALPPLPLKMTPSQAARLAEILDFLHRGLTNATDAIQASDDGTHITLGFADWQRVLAVQMLLARYLRAVAEPDALDE